MTARYITVKGSNTIALSPYYVGLVQHERTMSKKEAYAYCAERTGFTPTQVRAAFPASARGAFHLPPEASLLHDKQRRPR